MQELLMKCDKADRIYIYGAGMYAERIYSWLAVNNVSINGYIVSSIDNNPTQLHDKPVLEIESWERGEGDLIISSMYPKTKGYLNVFELLESRRIRDVFFFSEDELKLLARKYEQIDHGAVGKIFNHGLYNYEAGTPVEHNHFVFSQIQGDEKEYKWRISKMYMDRLDGRVISDFFDKSTALDEFQSIYGKYYPLKLDEASQEGRSSCRIYMATGASDAWALTEKVDSWIVPIQVGAALTEKRVLPTCDDAGDNISVRNKNWSEGTAIYWMWKNAPYSDYIGLCHYRRRLRLTEAHVKNLDSKGIDVVVTSPTFIFDNTETFLAIHTPKTDFDVLGKTIKSLFPDYSEAFEIFLKARFYPPCNLFLMRWEVFRKYGDMALPVCLAIDEYYDSIGFRRKDRYMGYLLEALLGVFLIRNKDCLKVGYTDMIFIRKEETLI